MKLLFYTKTKCPLCEKGLAAVNEVKKEIPFEIEERDIYTDDKWLETYQIRIPVVETEDGTVLDEGIISTVTLINNLKAYVRS